MDHPWRLGTLAQHVLLSPSQLARVFKEDTGWSPMAYLQHLRAERMAHLLRTTNATVAAAGRAVGWNDPSYAARRFKTRWMVSPDRYRSRFFETPGVTRSASAGC
ncbi:helix-turn-helix domain-containing protein [Mycobacterium sp. GA-2829]|uniref:helix-turn-helix domain-containing protein n=1 Tax=Mycobacterium sp. GA-2829 TaxID=1772283 RepID=UPI00351014E2